MKRRLPILFQLSIYFLNILISQNRAIHIDRPIAEIVFTEAKKGHVSRVKRCREQKQVKYIFFLNAFQDKSFHIFKISRVMNQEERKKYCLYNVNYIIDDVADV